MLSQVVKWFQGRLSKVPGEVVAVEHFVEKEVKIMSTTIAATAAHLNTINEAVTAVASLAQASGTQPSSATILQGVVTVASAMNPEVAMLATPIEGLIAAIMALRTLFSKPAVAPAVVPAAMEPSPPVFGPSA